ncbi:hypothetical protein [Thermus amyloliquefaciens]|uniref:hypothetical protein n=1 Tax=Thermus amyloliquefaciens TaxID=1449080 RepID=UPI001FDF95A9|nr:hypothetical protein [Thermus amyloliquefaciens]
MRVAKRLKTLVLGMLLSLPTLGLAMTPAGTVIRNQAAAWVGPERYLSNVAETVVRPLCLPSLTPNGTPVLPGQEAGISPGGYAYLPYALTNAGNATFTFSLGHALGPRDWEPEAVALFPDQDADGLPDTATPLAQATLAMGETLRLVLAVKAPAAATGTLLLTPVARCPDGREDADNYARLTLTSGPALAVEKEMPPRALPGEEVTVRLRVRNLGTATALNVILTDEPLPLPFVPGTAQAPKGRVEYSDGVGWSPSEPPGVKGIRLVLDRLLVGEEATLTFRLRVPPGTPPGRVENLARAEGPGGPAEGRATLEVLPLYQHHLGPFRNPRALPGGEGSADDQQQGLGLAGQPLCFPHTLENAGTVQDAYDLLLEGLPAGVGYSLVGMDGAPLAQPLVLGPGEQVDFQVCYLFPDAGAFQVRLVAVSRGTGARNATVDAVQVAPAGALSLFKEADPPSGTTLRVGEEITYTLRVSNGFAPLTQGVVEDALSPHVEFVSASHGGVYDPGGHRVVWHLDALPQGDTVLTLRVRVRAAVPDDTLVENAFSFKSRETPNPILSNTTRHPVFSVNLLLKKEVTPKEAVVGDLLTYRLILENPSAAGLTVRITDTPPPGTRYEPGTARVLPGCEGEGEALEPRVEGGQLIWENLPLGGKGRLCLIYKLRLLPGAPKELVNTAQALGVSENGAATASGKAQALALQRPGPFALEGVLLGRVFLDLDEDGRFGPGDIPLPNARVLLANGVQALTDASGRYAFRGLSGLHQVMLDPASAPFPPYPFPWTSGRGTASGWWCKGPRWWTSP